MKNTIAWFSVILPRAIIISAKVNEMIKDIVKTISLIILLLLNLCIGITPLFPLYGCSNKGGTYL
jgi:hypothetical protein